MKTNKILLAAFLNSSAIFLYVAGVAWLLTNGEKFFGKITGFEGPLALILLFVFSAAATGLLFFGRPAHLYFSGFKKEAIFSVAYTLIFLCLFTLLVFLYLVIF